MIAETLIRNFDTKISSYFPNKETNEKWELKFKEKIKHIGHDEPWLTLIASYSIFGDQNNITATRLAAINELLSTAGLGNCFDFSKIESVIIEKKLKEIIDYRDYLCDEIKHNRLHFYPDRLEKMKEKASFEGNTNLDLWIEGISNGRKTSIFIEAKFLSDISYHTLYNPVRDQIARNIDCGIDHVLIKGDIGSTKAERLEDFYFLLLTPKAFRTASFGKGNTSLNKLGSDCSRLYCYKMNDYKDPEKLKAALPHRKELKDDEWSTISKNIGWITFEDFYRMSNKHGTIDDPDEAIKIKDFFEKRNLI
jgi:hypothetical protein